MKVSIEYLKTGHIETRDCSEITFAQGRMILESTNQFSAFYPTDQVAITIKESEKKQEFVNSENLLETHLAKLSQMEKLDCVTRNEVNPLEDDDFLIEKSCCHICGGPNH